MNEQLKKICAINEFGLKIGLLMALLFDAIYYVATSLFLIPVVRGYDVLWAVLVYFALFGTLIGLAWSQIKNRFGLIVSLATLILFWFVINDALVRDQTAENVDAINIFGWFLIVYTTLMVFPLFINFVIHTYNHLVKNWSNDKAKMQFPSIAIIAGILCSIAISYGLWLLLINEFEDEDWIGESWVIIVEIVFLAIGTLILTPGAIHTTATILSLFHYPLIKKIQITTIIEQVKISKRPIIIILLIAGATIIPLSLLSSNIIFEEIMIEPKDYQAKFVFWGSHYHTRYTAPQLDAMNRHGITIAPYTVGALITQPERNAFISEMNWWKSNCPNVKFLPAVIGLPGVFVWDGCAENTTRLAKEIVQMIKDNNLTNVIGLSFDWESPVESTLGDVSSAPNRTRHEESRKIWNDFFDWKDENCPDMFFSCINYVSMDIDTYDGDFDLHYLERYHTYEIPRWSEYAPMIYRCGYKGMKPYGDYPRWNSSIHVSTTYDFYVEMKTHVDGVVRVTGDPKRVGVYLGITNCTCYGRDVQVYEYGRYVGTGYDMLVRDALICKSFEIPLITLFILDTVIENGYSMGGVFESYGDDFLDKFNASVNGINSTTPFTIPAGKVNYDNILMPDSMGAYIKDILFNFNQTSAFILFVGIFSTVLVSGLILDYKYQGKKTT